MFKSLETGDLLMDALKTQSWRELTMLVCSRQRLLTLKSASNKTTKDHDARPRDRGGWMGDGCRSP